MVPRQDLRDEVVDALRRGDLGEVVEEESAETPTLPVVAHGEGGLGDVVKSAVIVRDSDDCVTAFDDQAKVALVDLDSRTDRPSKGPGRRGEEPEVPRLVRQRLVELLQGRGVVGTDRTEVSGLPVRQDHVRFPCTRCEVHVRESAAWRRPVR